MKIFHDHDENGSWTEITTIKQYPTITSRMDETTQISFVINDFEGALYSTWSGYNFIPIKVEDDATNILFRGYLTGKKFKHDQLSCVAHGLSVRMDWIPFRQNYILAEGLVKTVPYAGTDITGLTENIIPNGNTGTNDWQKTDATWHESVVDYEDADYIFADENDDNDVQEIDFTAPVGTVSDCSKVIIYLYGKDIVGTPNMTVDLDAGDGYIGAQAVNFATSYSWKTVTFAGLANIDNADIGTLKVKCIAPVIGAGKLIYIKGIYCALTFTGSSVNAIELERDTEDEDKTLNWTAEQWVELKNTALFIRDITDNLDSETWLCTTIGATGEDADNGGNAADTTDLFTNVYWAKEDGIAAYTVDLTVDTAADKILQTEFISKLKITYRFGIENYGLIATGQLQIYNGSDWVDVRYAGSGASGIGIGGDPSTGASPGWVYNTTEITTSPSSYLDNDGAGSYDALKGLRILVAGGKADYDVYCVVDYLKLEIVYYAQTISPIMEVINQNGAEWIISDDFVWVDEGVVAGDSFVIGETCEIILTDIFSRVELDYLFQSTFTKYIAQNYKGTNCKEVLKQVILLEGFHWWEDFINNRIVISHEDDFVDSTEDLTEANYAHDWEFEDDNNYYSAVEVYGSAAYNIYYLAFDPDIDSPRVKTIISETITTQKEAKEVADAKLLEIKTKRPSIKIELYGVNVNIQVGTTVGLTMVRPTVGAADYPIRMIERSKNGGSIKTIIYCGLGHTTDQEKVAAVINKAMYLAHKAHTDRLISSPYAPGASFTWSDIGGADAAVNALIVAHPTNLSGSKITVSVETNNGTGSDESSGRKVINAVGEYIQGGIYLDGNVMDSTEDVVITFALSCTSADANVVIKRYLSAIKTDNSEGFGWNIDNGVADGFDSTVANQLSKHTFTFLAAAINDSDNLEFAFMLNEAGRTVNIYSVSATYTHV